MTGDGRKVLGRQYLWGVAEVENDGHCDFRKLRSLLIRTHMHDLIITNNEIHYENFRLQRIENRTAYVDKESLARAKALFDAKIKEEEQNFRSKISHKVYEVENRLREWEKKVAAERSRLQANLEFEQESLTMATKEIEQLELAGQ